jgi:formylglycine-generating enzyme required for sulfatase activity
MWVRMAKIFISYRRIDSQDFTDRLFEHMSKHFGHENVFQDVGDSNKIPLGVDFVEYLAEQVQQCDIVLVVIGEQWSQILKERETQDDDFVRIEVESALQQKKIVIPVLKSKAHMPSSSELPVSIQALARRNASRVRPNPDFAKDCETLAQGIRKVYAKTTGTSQTPTSKPTLAQALELARNFKGTKNTDWTPIIMPLGEIVPDTPMPEMEMCLVPVGKFMMGSDEYGNDEKPIHEQKITQPYWIARYPVTNAQWRKAVENGIVNEPKDTEWYNDIRLAKTPVVYVDWYQSMAFTQWIKGQLPSEPLWEFAARGMENWIYPWGNEWDSECCIYEKNPEYGKIKPAPVILKPEGASWVGAMHLSGNIWEWQLSAYGTYPYNATDGRENTANESDRGLRGGSWNAHYKYMRSSYRYWYGAFDSYGYLGFRCIRS